MQKQSHSVHENEQSLGSLSSCCRLWTVVKPFTLIVSFACFFVVFLLHPET